MMSNRWTVETSRGEVDFRRPLPIYVARLHAAAKRANLAGMLGMPDDKLDEYVDAIIDPWLLMGAVVGYSWQGPAMGITYRGRDVLDYGEDVLYWLMDHEYTEEDGQKMATTAFLRIFSDNPTAEEVDERVGFTEAERDDNS